jgi:hypothetical protein
VQDPPPQQQQVQVQGQGLQQQGQGQQQKLQQAQLLLELEEQPLQDQPKAHERQLNLLLQHEHQLTSSQERTQTLWRVVARALAVGLPALLVIQLWFLMARRQSLCVAAAWLAGQSARNSIRSSYYPFALLSSSMPQKLNSALNASRLRLSLSAMRSNRSIHVKQMRR